MIFSLFSLFTFYVSKTYKPYYFISNKNYKCSKCNVILITADALRADHIGFYGYSKNTTPFLDELAKESLVYLNAISQAGTTIESVSSLFMSKFPYIDRISEKDKSLSELLKKNGYYTKAIVGHARVKSIFGFSKGFDEFDDNFEFTRNASEMTSLAINWIKGNNKRPFFLWLHYREPHAPYTPPKEYFDMFYEPFIGNVEYHNYTIYGRRMDVSNEEIHNLSIAYDGNIRFLDDNLRILFKFLNNSGLLNNTLIIFTADYGESLGEHFIFDHNDLYYNIIHVPLILKHPYLGHKLINEPTALVDIFPTVLDVLDIKYNQNIRGESLFSSKLENRLLFAGYKNYYTLIRDEWKLMRGYCKEDQCTPEKLNQDYER
jgi:arylsulfatase